MGDPFEKLLRELASQHEHIRRQLAEAHRENAVLRERWISRVGEINPSPRLSDVPSEDRNNLPWLQNTSRPASAAHVRTRGNEVDSSACECVDAVTNAPDPASVKAVLRDSSGFSAKSMELKEIWSSEETTFQSEKRIRFRGSGITDFQYKSGLSTHQILKAGDLRRDDRNCFQVIVSAPTSKIRMFWDILSATLLAYDFVVIPLMPFEVENNVVIRRCNIFTTCFWTVDMLFSFFLGYYVQGYVEMRPQKTARNYLKTWFVLDISIILTDWAAFLVSSTSLRIVEVFWAKRSSVRLIRVLRVLRLMRLARALSVFTSYKELLSENMHTCLGVGKLLIAILFLNHLIACTWYAIGCIGISPNWVDEFKTKERGPVSSRYFYVSSLHWSLTQFTPASMEVLPQNIVERIFAILVLILGFLMFSSLVSSITNYMTKMRERNYTRACQREYVMQYLKGAGVSLALGNRVLVHLNSTGYGSEKKVHENDISVLKLLPDTLQKDLHCEAHRPHIIPHPLFHHIDELGGSAFVQLCHRAMSGQPFEPGSDVFVATHRATAMLFVSSGELDYSCAGTGEAKVRLEMDAYICESALWLTWEHHGTLHTALGCEIIALNAECFIGIVRTTPLLTSCRTYAQKYQAKLLQQSEGFTHVSDLSFDFDILQEMVHTAFDLSNMDGDVSIAISKPGLRRRTAG